MSQWKKDKSIIVNVIDLTRIKKITNKEIFINELLTTTYLPTTDNS